MMAVCEKCGQCIRESMPEVLKVSGFRVQGGLASAEAFCRDTKRVERMQSDLGRH